MSADNFLGIYKTNEGDFIGRNCWSECGQVNCRYCTHRVDLVAKSFPKAIQLAEELCRSGDYKYGYTLIQDHEATYKEDITGQELREIIQQAWCDGDGQAGDTFGDFLTRAAQQIEEAGYKSPEEVAFLTADVAKAEGYVKLAYSPEQLGYMDTDTYRD